MKATGIVRRIDDLGMVVIPKEIRRTLRIREGDPLHTTLTLFDKFCMTIHSLVKRLKARWNSLRFFFTSTNLSIWSFSYVTDVLKVSK